MKPIYWITGVCSVAIVIFIYLFLGDAKRTVPKINLSYFADETEIAESVTKRLSQELAQTRSYWIGVEPTKAEQLEVLRQLILSLQSKAKVQNILLDEELQFSEEWKQKISVTQTIKLKENEDQVAQLISSIISKSEAYILITASIYSTSAILKNPIHIIKEKTKLKPTTFSFAYMPINSEDEKNMLFPCVTEDYSGTASWACLVVNKARSVKRKIKTDIPKAWIGLMDLTGETDYMLLLRKK